MQTPESHPQGNPAPWDLVGHRADVRFTIAAAAEPGLLPRLLQPFARRDLVPDRFDARRTPEGHLAVEIALAGMPAEMVHLVEGNLRAIVGVHAVARAGETSAGAVRRAA